MKFFFSFLVTLLFFAYAEDPPKVKTPHVFGIGDIRTIVDRTTDQETYQVGRAFIQQMKTLSKIIPIEDLKEELADLFHDWEMQLAAMDAAIEVCDFKACTGKGDCKACTKDFCVEHKKKGGEFCESLSFGCQKAGEGALTKGHSISVIQKGTNTYCAVEPRFNIVAACWKSSETGTKILDDMKAARQMIYKGYELDKCEKDRKPKLFMRDHDLVDYSAKVMCCECASTDGKLKKVLFPSENVFYCKGACIDDGKHFIKRMPCTLDVLFKAIMK